MNVNAYAARLSNLRPRLSVAIGSVATLLLVSSLAQAANDNLQTASAGCGLQPAATGLLENQTITIDGVARTYEIQVPSDYRPGEPLPLLFGFHHLNGTVKDAEHYGPTTASNAERAIHIYPQGRILRGRTGWDETCGGPDMKFVQALKAMAQAKYCVATDRVFAYGFSYGADMTNAVGCCFGKEFRALAPQSGSYANTGSARCSATAPGYKVTYGSADPYYPQDSFAKMIAKYRALQGCSARSHAIEGGCVEYEGCREPVIECKIPGMTHEMIPYVGEAIWGFFSTFR